MDTKYRVFCNNLFLAFIFIWQSLRLTIFEGLDGKGRISIFISLAIFLINILSSKSFIKSLYDKKSILKIWLLWLIYAIINTIFQFNGNETPLFSFIGLTLIVPFVVMTIVANLPKNDIKGTLRGLQNIIYVSFLILFLFAEKDDGRLSIQLFDPNELSLIINLLVAIISLRYVRNELSSIEYLVLLILPSYYIVFGGSRMAFGCSAILIIGAFLSKREKFSFLLIIQYFFILIVLLSLSTYIIEETVLGERLLGTIDQSSELTDNLAEGTIFEYFGDRGLYYVLGWQIFIKNWVFGIGLKNFMDYYHTVNHVEFMIHLSELGIIGFILYISFNFRVLKKIGLNRKNETKKNKSQYTYLLFVLGSILFSASVLFLYSSIAISALYGLIILLVREQNYKFLKICT